MEAQVKTIEQLEQELKAAEDRNLELEMENESLNEANESLKKELAALAQKKEPAALKQFDHDGSKYEILVAKCNVYGFGPVTAADIIGEPKLQDALVKSKSGLIRKLYKEVTE